jgi:hypothetical protein
MTQTPRRFVVRVIVGCGFLRRLAVRLIGERAGGKTESRGDDWTRRDRRRTALAHGRHRRLEPTQLQPL